MAPLGMPDPEALEARDASVCAGAPLQPHKAVLALGNHDTLISGEDAMSISMSVPVRIAVPRACHRRASRDE